MPKNFYRYVLAGLISLAVYTNPSDDSLPSTFVHGVCEKLLLKTMADDKMYVSLSEEARLSLINICSSEFEHVKLEFNNFLLFSYVYNVSKSEALGLVVFGKVFILAKPNKT